jgi:hypothetical protein
MKHPTPRRIVQCLCQPCNQNLNTDNESSRHNAFGDLQHRIWGGHNVDVIRSHQLSHAALHGRPTTKEEVTHVVTG